MQKKQKHMGRKYILLNSVETEVNEKGKKKVKDLLRSGNEEGLTIEEYDRLGIPVPEHLLEQDSLLEEGLVKLEEGEYDIIVNPLLIDVNSIESVISFETHSVLTTKSGDEISIVENAYEVYANIIISKRNFFQRILAAIKNKFKQQEQ